MQNGILQELKKLIKSGCLNIRSVPYPQTAQSDYTGTHAMWQYTNQGTVAGISKPVDVDIAYFGYAGTADAKSDVDTGNSRCRRGGVDEFL